jgi:hypothetical protein
MSRRKPKTPATKPYSGVSFEAERKRFIEYLKTVLMLPPHEARREADEFFARHLARRRSEDARDRRRNTGNKERIDVLCQCGWGRLACPESELPTECPVCGMTFGQEPVFVDFESSSMSPPLDTDPRAVRCACGRLLYPGEVCSCSVRNPSHFLSRCAGCGRDTASPYSLCSACAAPQPRPLRPNGRALLPRSTRGWWRRNPDEMTVEEAERILSPWGGYSVLVHRAALALPKDLQDPKIIQACEVLAALERRS